MVTEDFPRTMMEFDDRFSSEDACRDYLMRIRWPDGFRCPSCGADRYWPVSGHLLECRSCGRQTSLTAGTVMHGTRKPLRMWFMAMWWICTQKTGGSARGLQRLLGLGSYQTAWAWLHKLRRAMIRTGREPLEGPVEVDDGFIGGEEEGVIGRKTLRKAKIVVAVEISGPLRSQVGRVRIRHVDDFSASSLVGFVEEAVCPGSRIITDAWTGYAPLEQKGFVHEVHNKASDSADTLRMLANVHKVVSLLKRWLMGTHQGAVRQQQLQHYLDEFVFRHNRRKSRHVGKVFYRMLQGSAATAPTPYKRLISDANPTDVQHMA
jgi:transposase-like protein